MNKRVQVRLTKQTMFRGHTEYPDTLMKVSEAEAKEMFRKGVAVPHGVGGVIHGRAISGDGAR